MPNKKSHRHRRRQAHPQGSLAHRQRGRGAEAIGDSVGRKCGVIWTDAEMHELWARLRQNRNSFVGVDVARCLACGDFVGISKIGWRAPNYPASSGLHTAQFSEMTAICPNCNHAALIPDTTTGALAPEAPATFRDFLAKNHYAFN